MKKFFLFFSICFFSQATFAQLDEGIAIDENETVIEESWLTSSDREEPVFSDKEPERSVASLHEASDLSSETREWNGHLSVVKEIPFSEPALTRTTLQYRTLIELEKEDKKNQ